MIRIRKRRRNPAFYDIADVPIQNIKKPIYNVKTDITRANVKLRTLIDEEKYIEARTLFIEIIKSNRYHFQHLWRTGIEVIGKSSPKDLTGYLKAVFISSPITHSAETFNVYIDQLILEKTWDLALEEIQLRYETTLFRHPILLRKMAICSYHLWKIARENLPEEYLEDGERDEHDVRIIRYEKHVRNATKYLSEAHKTYLRDAELLTLYYDYLSLIKEEDTIKDVILESLKENETEPEYYLLSTLLRLNEGKSYFESKDYILQLFEFDPYLDAEMGLKEYCEDARLKIKRVKKSKKSTEEEIKLVDQLATRIFKLYVHRFEHLNTELWFQKCMVKIFKSGLSDEIVNIYQYHNVDTLLRSPSISKKMEIDMIKQADKMKNMILKYKNEEDESEAEQVEAKEDVTSDVEDLDLIYPNEPGLERESFYDE